jgi:hypothetical protein
MFNSGCCFLHTRPISVPILTEVSEHPLVNGRLEGEPRTEEVLYGEQKNWLAIRELVQTYSSNTQHTLHERIVDNTIPVSHRLLYAAVLSFRGDTLGQQFLAEQARASRSITETRSVFWAIGQIPYLRCLESDSSRNPPDYETLRWAENLMCDMIESTNSLVEEQNLSYGGTFPKCALALAEHVGNFGTALGAIKSERGFRVLLSLVENTPEWVGERSVLSALSEFHDHRTDDLFLRVASNHTGGYKVAACALAEYHDPRLLPILLRHLDDRDTYSSLLHYRQDGILEPVRKALPTLKNEVARDSARLLIVILEDGDKLPKLMELGRDPKFYSSLGLGLDPLDMIKELKDERAIPFATEILMTSPNLYHRRQAVEILATFKCPQAVKALTDALEIDFQPFAFFKEKCLDQNEMFREQIRESLKMMTRQEGREADTKTEHSENTATNSPIERSSKSDK